MPVETAMQALRDDPESAEVAAELGIELEEYIEQVMHYALNPELEPQLEVMPDEDARALGVEVHTEQDIRAWLEGVEDGSIPIDDRIHLEEDDGFTTEEDASEALLAAAGATPQPKFVAATDQRPVTVPHSEAGSVLKQQLATQMRNPGAMDARRAQGKRNNRRRR